MLINEYRLDLTSESGQRILETINRQRLTLFGIKTLTGTDWQLPPLPDIVKQTPRSNRYVDVRLVTERCVALTVSEAFALFPSDVATIVAVPGATPVARASRRCAKTVTTAGRRVAPRRRPCASRDRR